MDSGYYIFLYISSIVCVNTLEYSCRDMKNRPIDWFMVYKIPKIEKSTDPLVKRGLASYYIDSNSPSWSKSGASINGTEHAIFFTINQINQNFQSPDSVYLLYNDETPDKNVSFNHGHTKGSILFDMNGGFWMVHSVPRYPQYSKYAYQYPSSGVHYGQTFLCMSLEYKWFNVVGSQLLYNYPQVYDYNFPKHFEIDQPFLKLAILGKHVRNPPWYNKAIIANTRNVTFSVYSKFTKFNDDLYAGWLSPDLGSSLLVESWRNGANVTASNCTFNHTVFNINSVSYDGIHFKTTLDHSKWAMTIDENNPYICIGDINRMDSQKRRAGGTVCTKLKTPWLSFKKTVSTIEPCPVIVH